MSETLDEAFERLRTEQRAASRHDYAHGLAMCSCGRIGLNHAAWEPSSIWQGRDD